jgi:hypothetical protein
LIFCCEVLLLFLLTWFLISCFIDVIFILYVFYILYFSRCYFSYHVLSCRFCPYQFLFKCCNFICIYFRSAHHINMC